MSGLKIARGVVLPIDYVTKTGAILAQRRKGKTYTGAVFAEELCAAKLPWVALDPTGAWWGLRSSADGLKAGLPVVVIGGQHGDLPLEPMAGAFVADLVVDHPGWYVIDLSLLPSRPAEREFATAFGERLLRRKMEAGLDFPMHLFVDEADMFLPQEKETKGDVALLAAYSAIIRRGGLHGLGSTLISQRPALINKNALTQLDLLLLLRLVAGNDQDAVDKNYISRFSTKQQRAEVMESLASLPVGTAWIMEPGAEPPLYTRVPIRERRTFNSSATPKPGEKRVEPKVLAKVDIQALTEQMRDTVERAKENDPAELHKTIKALRMKIEGMVESEAPTPAQIADALRATKLPDPPPGTEWDMGGWMGPTKQAPWPHLAVTPVEVSVLTEDDRYLLKKLEVLAPSVDQAVIDLEALRDLLVRAEAASATPQTRPEPRRDTHKRPAASKPQPDRGAVETRGASGGDGSDEIPKPQQKILDALGWYEALGVMRPTRVQIALIAGYSHTSGGYGNLISKLNTAGLVRAERGSNGVEFTDEGRALATDPGLPTTNEGVQEAILARLPTPQAKLLREIISVYPDSITRDDLADRTGYSASSGGYGNIISKLRTGALIEYAADRSVVALDVLFPMG